MGKAIIAKEGGHEAVLKGRVGGGQAEEDCMREEGETKERFNAVEDVRKKC